MSDHLWRHAFTVSAFSTLYEEVLRLKFSVEAAPWRWTQAVGEDGDTRGAAEEAARSVSEPLRMLLQELAREAARQEGETTAKKFEEARYMMAALADETFLNLDWEGRIVWPGDLLESQLFQTHFAGERVFQRIEALLLEQDADERDLGLVYLLALSLGFEGKYRGAQDREVLEDLRTRLLAFSAPADAPPATSAETLLLQPYAHTLDEASTLTLPRVRLWTLAVVASVLVYVVVSSLVWREIASPLAACSAAITNMEQEGCDP